jgi:hypothetical protein
MDQLRMVADALWGDRRPKPPKAQGPMTRLIKNLPALTDAPKRCGRKTLLSAKRLKIVVDHLRRCNTTRAALSVAGNPERTWHGWLERRKRKIPVPTSSFLSG